MVAKQNKKKQTKNHKKKLRYMIMIHTPKKKKKKGKKVALPPPFDLSPQAISYPRLETIITSTENSFPNSINFLAKSSL